MKIHHIHHLEANSTQKDLREYIKSNLAYDSSILVSTNKQTDGHGRQGSGWNHFSQALAFSFTLKPSKTLTLTPLEIGIHIAEFFSPQSTLKWPNDLLNKKKEKIGGIICQLYKDVILVGIGINLLLTDENISGYPYPIGALFDEITLKDNFKEELPHQIYEHILSNRLGDNEIIDKWIKYSCHLNQKVSIQDNNNKDEGIFIGLGKNGEAILKTETDQKKILTGSLRFL